MINASASQARGPGFESRREHSSFLFKSPDFVPVAPQVAFSGMRQARIENNLFIYLLSFNKIQRSKLRLIRLNDTSRTCMVQTGSCQVPI